MFTVDTYLGEKFHIMRNNCWHLVSRAWQDLTGKELLDLTPSEVSAQTCEGINNQEKFIEIEVPTTPCIVFFSRDKTIPHVGLFYKGKVLHISKKGVQYVNLDVARMGFSSVRFYVPSS